MPEFVVHAVPGSPYCRAVFATLVEKGAGCRLAPAAPGALKSPPHVLRHPFGRVPVLEHGGFELYETQAILRYLDRVLPAPALTPADPRAAARMDQAMNVCDWYLFPDVAAVIAFRRIVGPRLMGLEPDEAAIAAAMPQARVVFAALSRLLRARPFMAGDALSLADLILAPQLDLLATTPECAPLTAEAGNLAAWLDRMNARESLRETTWERVEERARAA